MRETTQPSGSHAGTIQGLGLLGLAVLSMPARRHIIEVVARDIVLLQTVRIHDEALSVTTRLVRVEDLRAVRGPSRRAGLVAVDDGEPSIAAAVDADDGDLRCPACGVTREEDPSPVWRPARGLIQVPHLRQLAAASSVAIDDGEVRITLGCRRVEDELLPVGRPAGELASRDAT